MQVTNAEGHSEHRQYDGRFGALVRLEGPNGLETYFTYDSFGRQTAQIRADGTRSEVYRAWCSTASPCGTTDAAIKVATFQTGAPASVVITDPYGRTLKTAQIGFDGVPLIAETEYDNKGQVAKVHKPYVYGAAPNPEVVTTFAYDVLGRPIHETAPGDTNGTATEYLGPDTDTTVTPNIAYRAGLRVTNDKSQVSSQYFDAAGRLLATVDAAGTATRYTYDAHGNVTTVTLDNDSSTTITHTYDVLGRKLTMADPDSGDWDYFYNSFGEVRRQEDANGNVTTLEYDLIGRLIERTENTTDVTAFTFDTASHGVGQLAEVTGPEGDTQTYTYDTLGRPTTTTTALPGVTGTFVTGQSYDPEGRVELVTYPASTAYPNGLQVRYSFNEHGYLEEVRNDDTGNALYWRLDAQTPTATTVTLGNGVTSSRVYDAVTGDLEAIRSSSPGQTHDVQDLEYAFDTLGNLTRRMDFNRDREESISASSGYDALNRVTTVVRKVLSTQVSLSTLSVSYTALGNIATKSDIGTYGYANPSGCAVSHAGPHAITSAGGQGFCYDASGNEVSGYDFTTHSTRATTWTAFGKPAAISNGTDSITFEYGADRARFREVNTHTGVTTLFIDGLFELQSAGGAETAVHYIYAAGEAVAIYKSYDDSSDETLFLHRDHLGNVVEITDASATVVESFSYDAFGRRREASDWAPATGEITASNTARGYTGHEHLEGVSAVVHMNGRVYDASLGRMLSADPYVQLPGYSQSYNRYSYVLNNPLRYTDPSGFLAAGLEGSVFSQANAVLTDMNRRLQRQAPPPPPPQSCDIHYCLNVTGKPPPWSRRGGAEQSWRYFFLMLAYAEPGGDRFASNPISVSAIYGSWIVFSGSVANNAKTGMNKGAEEFSTPAAVPQGGDPYNGWGTGSLPESLRDTGRGFWNAGIGIVEGAVNLLGGFTIPGASDYVPFLDGFRAEYEAPKFGAIIEVLGTVGTLKILGEIGAASRTSSGTVRPLDQQAQDLVPLNGGSNRVTIRSPSQQLEVDLQGRAHGGVPTPHTKVSERNLQAPRQPAYNTRSAEVRPATQEDIRTVRRYLERQDQ